METASFVLSDNVRKSIVTEGTEWDAFCQTVHLEGIRVPVLFYLEKGENGEKRRVIADGARRVIAARQVGLEDIPAYQVPKPKSEQGRIVLQLLTGLQHEMLSPMDEARAFSDLKKEGMSHDEIADVVGKTKSYVSLRVGLLRLIPAIQERVEEMGASAAYRASTLSEEEQEKYADAILAARTVKEVESLKKTIRTPKPEPQPPAETIPDPEEDDIDTVVEEILSENHSDEDKLDLATRRAFENCEALLSSAREAVDRAFEIASEHGLSISAMVDDFVSHITGEED